MLWRRCPGLMPRGLGDGSPNASRAVVRYNAKGLEGLHDQRATLGRLTADEEAALARSSSPGRSRARRGLRLDPGRSVPLAGGALRQEATPRHDGFYGGWDFPARRRARATREGTPKRSASKKGASRHQGDRRGASRKRLQLWFQDEARRTRAGCAQRAAPGTRQIGYQWAYIFSAVRPDTGDGVTLVMPSVNAKVMDLFGAHFADTLPGCARRHDVRPTSAPSPSPTTSPWRCCRLTARTQPRRAFGGANASYRSASSRHRGHHRRLLPSMDRPHRRTNRTRTLCAYPWIMKVHRLTGIIPRFR